MKAKQWEMKENEIIKKEYKLASKINRQLSESKSWLFFDVRGLDQTASPYYKMHLPLRPDKDQISFKI
jgi:hypothetical protein